MCGHTFEMFLTLKEAERPAYCPHCVRVENTNVVMERQPAAPAFQVHGYSAKNGYSSE